MHNEPIPRVLICVFMGGKTHVLTSACRTAERKVAYGRESCTTTTFRVDDAGRSKRILLWDMPSGLARGRQRRLFSPEAGWVSGIYCMRRGEMTRMRE